MKSKNRLKGRDKDCLGVVQSGFESIKNQRDPYDVFAVMEFEKYKKIKKATEDRQW